MVKLRSPTPSELSALSKSAQAYFSDVGRVDDAIPKPEKKTRAVLEKKGFAAHAAALAFDATYAGLITFTEEDVGQALVFGIHSMLKGRLHDAYGAWLPRDALGKTRTPIGAIAGIEATLFMDEAGVVTVYSDTQGEWFPGAKSGIAFLEQFATDFGPKPAKKKSAAKKK